MAALEGEMAKVIDPELGRSVVELKLIDRMEAREGLVEVDFHLTAPFCPPMFALKIASDIRAAALRVPGVAGAKVTLRGHYLAEAVNKQVNGPQQPRNA